MDLGFPVDVAIMKGWPCGRCEPQSMKESPKCSKLDTIPTYSNIFHQFFRYSNSLQCFLEKRDKLNSHITVQEKKMFPEKSRKPMIRLYCFPGAADNYMCLIWEYGSQRWWFFFSLASKKCGWRIFM